MPNPYHDADGKFCSRDGMRESIQILIKDNRVDEALKLTSELKAIDDTKAHEKSQTAFVAEMEATTTVPAPQDDKQEQFDNFSWGGNKDGPRRFIKLLEATGAKTSPEDEENLRNGLEEIRRDGYDDGVNVEMNSQVPKKIDAYQLTDNLMAQLESGGQIDPRAKRILVDMIENQWDSGYQDGSWDS